MEMELLNFGGAVSKQEHMELQQAALGKLMFRLSNWTAEKGVLL